MFVDFFLPTKSSLLYRVEINSRVAEASGMH